MSEDLAPEASSGFSLWFKDVRLGRESAVCGWGLWRHPGMEARLGWERLFRTTSHMSLEVTSNSTVSAPGVTLRTFWKHIPYTCSKIQDPRWSRRKRSQGALLERPIRAQLVQVTHGTHGLTEIKGQEGKRPLQGHTVAHGTARVNTWRGSMAGLNGYELHWP